MGMKAKSAKAKGTRFEKDIAKRLTELGCAHRRDLRQPYSGGHHLDFPDDIEAMLPDGRFTIECKRHKGTKGHVWTTGDRWIGYDPRTGQTGADMLVVQADHHWNQDRPQPMVYMPWGFFARLVSLAHGGRDVGENVPHPPQPVSEGADSAGTLMPVSEIAVMEAEGRRINAPQSLLTGKTGKPKPKPNKWGKR